jgi:hypothetical protein
VIEGGRFPTSDFLSSEAENSGVPQLPLTVRERVKCRCGQVATKRHTYLLHDWESNPKSSGYGKSGFYAADAQAFTCDACPGEPIPGYVPNTRYDWPLYESTFYKTSTRRIDVATLSEAVRRELGLL